MCATAANAVTMARPMLLVAPVTSAFRVAARLLGGSPRDAVCAGTATSDGLLGRRTCRTPRPEGVPALRRRVPPTWWDPLRWSWDTVRDGSRRASARAGRAPYPRQLRDP